MIDIVLAESINRFGLDLCALLRERPGTLFFSPLSIASGFAAARAGARGATAEQIAAVMKFPPRQQELDEEFLLLLDSLGILEGRRGYTVRMVTALGVAGGSGHQPAFRDLLARNYLGLTDEYDFAASAEAARESMNSWAAERTHGKVRELFESGSVHAGTQLALASGIYFKAQWLSHFLRSKTRDGDFQVTPDYRVSVPFMFQEERFNFVETDLFDAVELPYLSFDYSLLIFVPRALGGMEEFERQLSLDSLAKWGLEFRARQVSVALPRLRLEAIFDLRRVLGDLGLRSAFEEDADFSGVSGGTGLKLSCAVHRAILEVNEEGKEAAAATNPPLMMSPFVQPVEPASLRADRPFFLLIRHNATGALLFLARVTNPRESLCQFAG
jgi:serpin B